VLWHYQAVKSRVLIGASAWLLGAVTATTGSMIAVNQLAHGLYGQPAQLLGSSAVADRDHDSGGQPAANSSATFPTPSPSKSRAARPRPTRTRHAAVAPSSAGTSASGTLLESPDGSVMAECLPAGAYLLYWSPNQGFQADEANAGPAPTASVTFRGAGSTVVMHVSCQGGIPVKHLYWPGGGPGHDE
jgi:hypothetical protein